MGGRFTFKNLYKRVMRIFAKHLCVTANTICLRFKQTKYVQRLKCFIGLSGFERVCNIMVLYLLLLYLIGGGYLSNL